MSTKTCTKCKEGKESAEFWKTKKGKDGLRAACIECTRKQNGKWWATPKANTLNGKWRRNNPELSKVKANEWRNNNNEKCKAYQKKCRDKPEMKAKNAERHRLYAKNNPEKLREIAKRFRENNPDKVRETNRLYRGLRRSREKTTDITPEFLLKLKKKTGDTCPYCLKVTMDWHLDHKTPLIREGLHEKKNVIYCCAVCNLQKRTRTDKEFLHIIRKTE